MIETPSQAAAEKTELHALQSGKRNGAWKQLIEEDSINGDRSSRLHENQELT